MQSKIKEIEEFVYCLENEVEKYNIEIKQLEKTKEYLNAKKEGLIVALSILKKPSMNTTGIRIESTEF